MYDAFAEQREFTSDDILRNLRETIPISRTMAEKIEELRSWAGVRARRANELVNESQAEKLEPIPSEPTA
jgi:hypothetical protein